MAKVNLLAGVLAEGAIVHLISMGTRDEKEELRVGWKDPDVLLITFEGETEAAEDTTSNIAIPREFVPALVKTLADFLAEPSLTDEQVAQLVAEGKINAPTARAQAQEEGHGG